METNAANMIATSLQTYIAFGIYLVFMVAIGLFFSRKSSTSVNSYLLGDRGMGSWVTALLSVVGAVRIFTSVVLVRP